MYVGPYSIPVFRCTALHEMQCMSLMVQLPRTIPGVSASTIKPVNPLNPFLMLGSVQANTKYLMNTINVATNTNTLLPSIWSWICAGV